MSKITAKDIVRNIPRYPDPSSKRFIYDTTRKAEFYEHRLERSEPTPEQPGELLETQKFIKAFLAPETPNKAILLNHGLGSGKSCTSSAVIENFKNVEVGGKKRKPAIVLVGNGVLKDSYAKQVSEICTSGIYVPKTTMQERRKGVVLSEELKFKRTKRMVAESYRIVTFGTFLKNLSDDDNVVREEYRDRVIVVDEAHAFRIQPRKGSKSTKISAKTSVKSSAKKEADADASVDEDIDDAAGDNVNTKGVDIKTYQRLHRFLHIIADSCRILLLTGTPIWDQTSEIASLMNLILPLDQQLPTGTAFDRKFFDENGDLIEGPDTSEVLKKAFHGRVSFLRQMMTTAKREEMGVKKPFTKYVKIFPDQMSKWQAEGAEEALKTAVAIKKTGKSGKKVEVEGGEFAAKAREAANLILPVFGPKDDPLDPNVYPDFAYGKEAFAKYAVKKIKKMGDAGAAGKTMNLYGINDPKIKIALTENLERYSAKFASIIADIKAHPNEVTFIYNERVTGTGGAIMLALCMQLHGFQWVRNASEIQKPGKMRFAVITNDPQTTHLDGQISKLLDRANQPDNAYGDHLQVIIGSEKISLGVTIKSVRREHTIMPHWNMPSIDQALARGFRFGGHDFLPPDKRHIKIFKHAAVNPGKLLKGTGFPSEAGFSNEETIDVRIYKRAEEKEHKNTQIYRIMKRASVDCALFYNRNVLPEDIDGTRDCDYQECNYTCDGYPSELKPGNPLDPSLVDHSTANLYYSGPKIKKIIDDIIKLFGSYFSLRVDAIKDLLILEDSDMPLMLRALDNIISNRIAIRNRYGFISYLKEKSNIVFLDFSITPKANYPEVTYVENPLVTEKTSLDFLVDIMELEHDREKVEDFCHNPSEEKLDEISHNTKIVMLEAAYVEDLRLKSGVPRPKSLKIIKRAYEDDIYRMSDGIDVHILYTEEFKGVAYDVAAKLIKPSGLMRWYDSTEEKWRYIDDISTELAYIPQIKAALAERKQDDFEGNEYGVFGTIAKKDKAFRITIKLETGKSRGKKCETWQVPDLVDIFVSRIKDFPPSRKEYKTVSKEELIKGIKGRTGFQKYKNGLEERSEKYLRGLLTVMTMSVDELCTALRKWLEENDLMFEV